MNKKFIKIFFLLLILTLIISTISCINAENDTNKKLLKQEDKIHTQTNSSNILNQYNKINKKNASNSLTKNENPKVNITINKIKTVDYITDVSITGKIIGENNLIPNKEKISLYVNNQPLSNNNFTIDAKNGNYSFNTRQPKGNHSFKIVVNDSNFQYATNQTNFSVTEKIFPLLDKTRPIYFAMDHTSNKDNVISSLIVDTLLANGFNVVRSNIGPNAMYSNMVHVYNRNIDNAILFHLFNGVDPSNIREVAVNGNDNRGRIVRSRGNDVVLAWFYDSADPVHENGSCYKSVRASETGSRLDYPKVYMDENDIYSICTSSDGGRHVQDADYLGDKTVEEFMKLFKTDTRIRNFTEITASITNIDYGLVDINGTVYSNNTPVSGEISISNDDGSILASNVKVIDGTYNTTVKFRESGEYFITVFFVENELYSESQTFLDVKVSVRPMSFDVNQMGYNMGYTNVTASLINVTNDEGISGYNVLFETENGSKYIIKTDKNGLATLNYNYTYNQTIKVTLLDENNQTYDSANIDVKVVKNPVIVTVNPVVGVIGENIHLVAQITDMHSNRVNGGNLVFKLNGKTLRSDKRFDSSSEALKFSVHNGTVYYTIKADLYLRNAKNLTASYSGNALYEENKSDTVTAQIKKRFAQIELTVTPEHVNHYDNLTINIKVNDKTTNNTDYITNSSYVMIKINNRTITDSRGKVLKFYLDENNTVCYNYTIASGTGGINNEGFRRYYFVSVVFSSDNYYPDTRNSTNFTIERSNILIDISDVVIKDGYMNISANITDYKCNYVIGTNKVLIKINGVSYINATTKKAVYYEVHDGIIELRNIMIPEDVHVKRIMLVTGERQAYYENRAETFDIKYV